MHKTVHFFLMRPPVAIRPATTTRSAEAVWLTVDGALDRMTYPNERQIVRLAVEKAASGPAPPATDARHRHQTQTIGSSPVAGALEPALESARALSSAARSR